MYRLPGFVKRMIKSAFLFALILLGVIFLLSPKPTVAEEDAACEYWVAPPPAGSDNHPGTYAAPWATLRYAADNIPDNYCTVWFKAGDYYGTHRLNRRYKTETTFKAVRPYRTVLHYNGVVVNLSGATNVTLEGFRFHHTSPNAEFLVVTINRSASGWAENITLRNNIFHDSYNNDLLKIHNGSRFITIENNIFYNQGPGEEHIDVNSVTDVLIQDNIFFNDFAGSGQPNPGNTKAFITIKDSNEESDGLTGSERITLRRNIFLNWQGGKEPFLQIGNDGKAYHEAKNVLIENNLMVGNSLVDVNALLALSGVKNVTFANNTVVGDLPASAYAFRIDQKSLNPQNQDFYFYNNIWSDPTGTMGAGLADSGNKFANGDPERINNLVLDNNLYWNGGVTIPPGVPISPLVDDAHRTVANPLLNTNHEDVILPRWNGFSFLSGNTTIRQEFFRLVDLYGRIPASSPAIGQADPSHAPADDILGNPRSATPDLGAFEFQYLTLTGSGGLTTILLDWTDPNEPGAASFKITYTTGTTTKSVHNISINERAYTLTGLLPLSLYTITLTVHDSQNALLAQSNDLVLLTAGWRVHLPLVIQ